MKDLALARVESMTDLQLMQYAKDARAEIINLRCEVQVHVNKYRALEHRFDMVKAGLLTCYNASRGALDGH